MTSVKLETISPIFAAKDLTEAVEFYRRTLGFELAWSWGTPADIAAVCRDSVEITLASRPDAQPRVPSMVYLRVVGIDAYYDQIVRAGATIVVPIADRVYGMRDFRVADPSGNELSVGEPLAPDDPSRA